MSAQSPFLALSSSTLESRCETLVPANDSTMIGRTGGLAVIGITRSIDDSVAWATSAAIAGMQ